MKDKKEFDNTKRLEASNISTDHPASNIAYNYLRTKSMKYRRTKNNYINSSPNKQHIDYINIWNEAINYDLDEFDIKIDSKFQLFLSGIIIYKIKNTKDSILKRNFSKENLASDIISTIDEFLKNNFSKESNISLNNEYCIKIIVNFLDILLNEAQEKNINKVNDFRKQFEKIEFSKYIVEMASQIDNSIKIQEKLFIKNFDTIKKYILFNKKSQDYENLTKYLKEKLKEKNYNDSENFITNFPAISSIIIYSVKDIKNPLLRNKKIKFLDIIDSYKSQHDLINDELNFLEQEILEIFSDELYYLSMFYKDEYKNYSLCDSLERGMETALNIFIEAKILNLSSLNNNKSSKNRIFPLHETSIKEMLEKYSKIEENKKNAVFSPRK